VTRDTSVDYDRVARVYDARYRNFGYPGTEETLRGFVGDGSRVVEAGCGTGHWTAFVQALGCRSVGVDPSREMLARAATRDGITVVRGCAERLPFRDAAVDRVICVNAWHHFADPAAFVTEARRVLRDSGGLLAIGLDPHTADDRWAIYDWFPETRELDRRRYPPASTIRALITAGGFVRCATRIADHLHHEWPARAALDLGLLDQRSTSQLTLLTDAQYAAGIARIRAACADADARGSDLMLSSDVRLWATTAWLD
jgi:ubiquinone/menaquinone biosynthesis C-methylase UbiE